MRGEGRRAVGKSGHVRPAEKLTISRNCRRLIVMTRPAEARVAAESRSCRWQQAGLVRAIEHAPDPNASSSS